MIIKLTWTKVSVMTGVLAGFVAIWFAIGLPGPAFTTHITDVKKEIHTVKTQTQAKLMTLEERTKLGIHQAAELGRSAWLVILYQKRGNAEAKRDRASAALKRSPTDKEAQERLTEAYRELNEINRQISNHERLSGSRSSR